MPRRCLIALACLGMLACSVPSRPTAAAPTQQPGPVACPDGKPDRAGLSNFGPYIGTWETAHRRAPQASDSYAIGPLPGHVTVRCSAHDFVIAEAISPRNQVPAGLALRVALSDLPDDAVKVYEHVHTKCSTLQYQSKKLAQQLGPDDNDGRAAVVVQCHALSYHGAAVY